MAAPIVDTRILGKPQAYSNNKAEWPEFQFTLKSYVGAISEGILNMMERAETMDAPVKLGTLTEEERRASRTLMYILNGVLQGSGKRLLMNTEAHNGIEAYRVLCKREDPSTGNVQVAQLSRILATRFSGKASEFQDEVEKLEADVRRYEQTYSEIVGDALLQSILKNNSPPNLRQQVQLQTFKDYYTLKSTLVEYMTSLAATSDMGTPMDVGAVNYKGYPTWPKGGKDPKGKGKWGKDTGKKGKGKNKDGGGGQPGHQQQQHQQQQQYHAPRFQGYCNHCWKWGHKKSECRNRPQRMEVGAADAVLANLQLQASAADSAGHPPAAGAASSSAAAPRTQAAISMDDPEDGWIF